MIVYGSLIFLPLALMLFIQIRFSAYHSLALTLFHYLVFSVQFLFVRRFFIDLRDVRLKLGLESLASPVAATPRQPELRQRWARRAQALPRTATGWLSKKAASALSLFLLGVLYASSLANLLILGLLVNGVFDKPIAAYTKQHGQHVFFFLPRLHLALVDVPKKDVQLALDHLANRDYRLLFLEKVKLNNLIFSRLQLQNSILLGCDFSGCQLYNVALENATLARCKFTRSKLSQVQLPGSTLLANDFRRATIDECNLDDAQLSQNTFIGCEVRNSRFRHASLTSEGLIYQYLLGTGDFVDCLFRGVDFTGAQLTECHFRAVTMQECIFDATKINADFQFSKITSAVFTGAYLKSEIQYSSLDLAELNYTVLDVSGGQNALTISVELPQRGHPPLGQARPQPKHFPSQFNWYVTAASQPDTTALLALEKDTLFASRRPSLRKMVLELCQQLHADAAAKARLDTLRTMARSFPPDSMLHLVRDDRYHDGYFLLGVLERVFTNPWVLRDAAYTRAWRFVQQRQVQDSLKMLPPSSGRARFLAPPPQL